MPRLSPLTLLTLFALESTSFAQSSKPAAAPKAEDIVSSATLSFRDNGAMDRALLALGEDNADLYLYLADDDASGPRAPLKLALVKKELVWSGGMWGTLPSLSATGRGSLIVKSENSAIGRNRWEESLTVAYRNKEFVVLGITYTSRDTIDLKAGGNCDINFATGKGTRNGKPVTVPAKTIRVADWTEDARPKVCEF